MGLWAKFKDFVEGVGSEQRPARDLREEELRLAAAALLVRASAIDGQVDAVERRKLKVLLQERFDLDDEEMRPLLDEAAAREHDEMIPLVLPIKQFELKIHGHLRIIN